MALKHRVDAALILVVALQGCSSTGPKGTDPEAADGRGGGAEVGRYGPGDAAAVGSDRAGGTADSRGGLRAPANRVIYFAYDSDDVLPEYVPVINAHAAYLGAGRGRSATLAGHADERGSSEYNIALGEQRARAVARMLSLQGVADGQLQIVSYGEEKAADPGHDEAAWQRNRRVEFIYTGR